MGCGEEGKRKEWLTMLIGVGMENAKLMAQHVELHFDVGAELLGEEGSQLGLDVGLLVEQVLDGGVQGWVIRRRGRGQLGLRNGAGAGIGPGPSGRRKGGRRGRCRERVAIRPGGGSWER